MIARNCLGKIEEICKRIALGGKQNGTFIFKE